MIKKNILSLFFSVLPIFLVSHAFSLQYEVRDLGIGSINHSPYYEGLKKDEFVLIKSGEALRMDFDTHSNSKKNHLTIFEKSKKLKKIQIHKLKNKKFIVYRISKEIILGTFSCDASCDIHRPDEKLYNRTHLFAYYWKQNKFVDLRLEATKAGFSLFPFDDDWIHDVFINDTGTIAGSFLIDGTVDSNKEYSLFHYHPDFGMQQIAINGIGPDVKYKILQLNNRGQFLFRSGLFNYEKEDDDDNFYLFDPKKGFVKLDALNNLINNTHHNSSFFYGLSDLGDILIKMTSPITETTHNKIFIYNVFNDKIITLSEEGVKTRIISNILFNEPFNAIGQIAFLKIKMNETEKEFSLGFWDPDSGENSFKLPPNFNDLSVYGHGIDDNGRIFVTDEDELFIWDKNTGIHYLRDLIITENQFYFRNLKNIVINHDGSILVEVQGEASYRTHVVLLIPRE